MLIVYTLSAGLPITPLSQSAICGGTIGGNPSVCESEITFVVESVMCRFPCVCSRVLFCFLSIRSHFVCILCEKSPPIYCAWFGVMGLCVLVCISEDARALKAFPTLSH